MVFEFDKVCRDIYDRIEIWFDIENDPIYSDKFKRRLRWFGYTGIPAFLNFVSIILFFIIFFRIYASAGFEKTVIILLLVIVITLRGLKPKPAI